MKLYAKCEGTECPNGGKLEFIGEEGKPMKMPEGWARLQVGNVCRVLCADCLGPILIRLGVPDAR